MENNLPTLIERDLNKDYKIAIDIASKGEESVFTFVIATVESGKVSIEQTGTIKDKQIVTRYSHEKFYDYTRTLAKHFNIPLLGISQHARSKSRREKELRWLIENQQIKLNIC